MRTRIEFKSALMGPMVWVVLFVTLQIFSLYKGHLTERARWVLIIGSVLSVVILPTLVLLLRWRPRFALSQHGLFIPSVDHDEVPWHLIGASYPVRGDKEMKVRVEFKPGYRRLVKRTLISMKYDRHPPLEQSLEIDADTFGLRAKAHDISFLINSFKELREAERVKAIAQYPHRPRPWW
jgi:hypothetical protein